MLLLIFGLLSNSFAQSDQYDVSLAPFSTNTNDEFSPVYYNHGIVYCSNLRNNSLITYKSNHEKLFNIFFASLRDSGSIRRSGLFAKEISTNYNEGPVTFNETGNMMYFGRNNIILNHLKDISDTSNTLGIFFAELADGKWTNIKPFVHNSLSYSIITPALSNDGTRLYFASDMPGGYGGTDLYYCNLNGNEWEKPVNLGAIINTVKNESFPFQCKSGKLFFASDGHEGLGGKDIFYTIEVNGEWITPFHLAPGINSPANDFSLVTDENLKQGYFASDRRRTADIYSFKSNDVQFAECDTMITNNYCFLFYDAYQKVSDTLKVKYVWDFGNGIKKQGLSVKHCFPGPGKYEVKLFVTDSIFGDSIIGQSLYRFELKDAEQVYIYSPNAGIINREIPFDGFKSNLPGFSIKEYLWDFGEGFASRGPSAKYTYPRKGEYMVKLGLLGDKDSSGNYIKACSCRKIKIFEDYQELAAHTAIELSDLEELYTYTGFNDTLTDSVLIDFKSVQSHVTDSFKTKQIKIYLTSEIPEHQKHEIYKLLYNTTAPEISMNNDTFAASSRKTLLRFVQVLKENPNLKLEIAVHNFEPEFQDNSIEISERWANNLYLFLTGKGAASGAVTAKGYGNLRPDLNTTTKPNANRANRVEFIFIDNEY